MSTADASEKKTNFRKTLNLPRTSFPMKANLVQNEPQSMKRWEKLGLYAKLRDERAGSAKFVFHDGPPYANGSIHLGHMLNKCLKDFVVRTKAMAGFDTPYTPGWDCHGLPIEHQVMTAAVESGKIKKLETLSDSDRRRAVRSDCEAHAKKFIKQQSGEMKRLLTMADYDAPYLTMQRAYEAETLRVFAEMVEQGIVYRALKAVHWSPANETALAEAELEYMDRDDLSVYVVFEAEDQSALASAFGVNDVDGAGFMIWTTTPWTLPANLAVAVHNDFEYALVELGGRAVVVAKEMIGKIAGLEKHDEPQVIATCKGSDLVGLRYMHPFIERAAHEAALRERHELDEAPTVHRVVAADYVTLEDGTGLVHTAPGHGQDDYQTGLREGLPIYCPVLEDGSYDDSAPEWVRGQVVFDANQPITDRLKASGHLYHSHVYSHSYPHDWRGKTPVIFRATEQWFVAVDRATARDGKTLRELAEASLDSVEFIPAWGRKRLAGMLESRPDWCLSRQRSWGLPIPAFRDAQGNVLLTPASVRAVAEVVEQKGSGAWLTEAPSDLLASWDRANDPGAPAELDESTLAPMQDIFDVWFESGCSWASVMRRLGQAREDAGEAPVDLYLEGSDQHRGWFQVSMLTGLGAIGRPPYAALLTHGFMVDKDGRKMSKSLGNTINVADVMEKLGADVARWWVATLSYENDIKTDWAFLETAGEAYRKVRNTLRFMLSNLEDFEPSPPGKDCSSGEGMCVPFSEYPRASLDAWALAEFDKLSSTVREAYAAYNFRAAAIALFDFCNDQMSAVYLAATKDRLYCDRPDSARRRRVQSTMWDLVDGLCRLLAPILPHTADEAYRALHKTNDADVCVHLKEFIGGFGVECDAAFGTVMEARDKALFALESAKKGGGVENPLDAGLTLPDPHGALATLDAVDLADLMGVSRVSLKADGEVEVHDLRGEPRCERSWKRDGTVKERAGGAALSDRDAEAVGAM